MTTLGTALTPNAIKVMMLGSGELGKEVVIELQRLGVEVIAVDRYENAPAQQVAHRAYTISMLDGAALKALVEKERPDYIVPEVEAIATDTLIELEKAGFNVVPTAKATKLTMNREGIRRLAAEELGLPTSPYQFVDNFAGFQSAVEKIGIPCVVTDYVLFWPRSKYFKIQRRFTKSLGLRSTRWSCRCGTRDCRRIC